MRSADDWRKPYIAGLVDNHAGVVVTVGKDDNRKIGYRVQSECRIKLESADTKKLLSDFLNEYEIKARVKDRTDTSYDRYEITIGRRSDIREFIELVAPYLIRRKDAMELLATRIIPGLEAGMHQEKASFLELLEDIERFRELVGRANRAKYDLNYFQEEWNVE
jgi:hypothetical protein